ncbi:MAG: fibrillarin-like rRNA/tRNA 2'-O-methyltransferase [Methanothrix sp.]|uniref:Fibrillarin-like rRNA/tRNA 2'-O-methyltransferase n=1 Tax=Methanothrix harundinacea TaxID=301375 RepID=A0A117MD09_9EURY|nr:MAG: Fibrillarin-like rRNA/tRNA 2'-O-methyltransferase [Methanothrix harundinacea]MDD2638088.1 fibrillarin-like rRNA/tRNA 2'-O-methyltransferase [Methanothrix sp.]MDI9400052.1 fibrillarin-like rRNA/tRNA 2'-O-methyltransferase [Euryarchaeota archaeon]KUK97330.1 MAG: Fibrillarin-like rRNA/tRNA 2'-O-methyltransferase [Methanothrix harundinacea]MCP1393308.1 fibrillarin-like rRNA/tRNA 2'-O-methyltransferase [Methanothrix harundinacea]
MHISENLSGVYVLDFFGETRMATRPKVPVPVYGERIAEGLRIWDPRRSKLAALLIKSWLAGGLGDLVKMLNLRPDSKVLYLGAATGTTVSHVSDLLSSGLVYAVEFSPRSMRDLFSLCQSRDNIIPLLEDASLPERYAPFLEPVDLVYQDVAQRNQAQIACRNAALYLKSGGALVLMIKARSVDVTADPKDVQKAEIERLEGVEVISVSDLRPYYQDHWAVVARRRDQA